MSIFFMFMAVTFVNTIESNATLFVQHGEEQKVHKVVFHMTSNVEAEHKAMFQNIRNLSAGWEGQVKIEVVVHGPGINLVMKNNPLAAEAFKLQETLPVRISICENTLKQRDIKKSELYPGFHFVPMGVAHVIELQERGYSYIKANF